MKDQQQAVETMKSTTPGTVPTTSDGYTMTAKLDGKEWKAGSMMPPEAPSRIIGYNNGEFISFPYDRRKMVAGNKITFTQDYSVDLTTDDDVKFWAGRKGEMTITKVDDNMAEGTFFFTASANGSTKTIEVTDGFFRILFAKSH
jgi:hypothetical protein